MSGYTKLFSSILASTIWEADMPTRIVWITLLAMADQYGIAEASIPGLAHIARVSREQCEQAIENLLAPDPDSRSKDDDGRRIRPVDGGWQLVNHGKYRERRTADERREYLRLKQAEQRAKRDKPSTARQQASTNVSQCQHVNPSDPAPSPDPKTDPDQDPKPRADLDPRSSARAPVWNTGQGRHQNGSSLVGNHRSCFPTPEACARGLCLPAHLGQQWTMQLRASDHPDPHGYLVAFVHGELDRLSPGPIGDDPLKFWRAAWSARNGSQAPAPSEPARQTKGSRLKATIAEVERRAKARTHDAH